MLRDMMRPPSTQKSPSKPELSRARRCCCSKTPFVFSRFLALLCGTSLSLSLPLPSHPIQKGVNWCFFFKGFFVRSQKWLSSIGSSEFFFVVANFRHLAIFFQTRILCRIFPFHLRFLAKFSPIFLKKEPDLYPPSSSPPPYCKTHVKCHPFAPSLIIIQLQTNFPVIK